MNHAQKLDFKLTPCYNVVYKVITKLIYSRVSRSCGLPNISGTNNFHWRKWICLRCMIKVDLRRAYESVNWEFLWKIMLGMRFPDRFIKWVMECVSIVSYLVKMNAIFMATSKGKGDFEREILYPYVYSSSVWTTEYLSRLLNLRAANSEFNYHPKCGSLKITYWLLLMIYCLCYKGMTLQWVSFYRV